MSCLKQFTEIPTRQLSLCTSLGNCTHGGGLRGCNASLNLGPWSSAPFTYLYVLRKARFGELHNTYGLPARPLKALIGLKVLVAFGVSGCGCRAGLMAHLCLPGVLHVGFVGLRDWPCRGGGGGFML